MQQPSLKSLSMNIGVRFLTDVEKNLQLSVCADLLFRQL